MLKEKKFLILGKDGQLGYEFCSLLLGEGVEFRALGRKDCNFGNFYELQECLETIPYDILINASAYNFVDRAETEKEEALKINSELPKFLAEAAKQKNAKLIHYSTDYVFDGKKSEPYEESDRPNPINFYGTTKLKGEEYVQNSGALYQIFRVSWVYSLRRHNFLKTMLRLAQEKDELKVVNDQIGAPTWARTIAEISFKSLMLSSGIYHLAPTGEVSWHGFTEKIFYELASKLKRIPKVTAISSKDFGSSVQRPSNSRLNTDKLKAALNIELPSWDSELSRALSEFKV